ncbi:hypothetical protein RclHR1_04630009 [Rhizophagus clarus]|uniref:Uncharacterized protein n=1 Tax=Rhizophagus clarus TaxID=94130 RepID=A0A2Z6RNC6_9GLOM|nr:hypothetical protein RclHR1_04630009 [Rhizophagus clarus]GET00335.1 hypothetical protein GLOIN_2v1788471 [Rhizophagus clarus]
MFSKFIIFLLFSFLLHFIQFSLCEVEFNDKRSEPSSHHSIEKRAQKESITNLNIYGIIGIAVFGAFLIFCFVVSFCMNRKAMNGVILSIPWTLLDLVLQALFIKDHVRAYPSLFISSIIFLVFPMVVNVIFAFFIILNEKKKRSKVFEDWFHKNSSIAATATILAGADMSAFKLLYSRIFRLRRFNAPFSDSSKNLVLWGCILNSIIQDVPQFIIQVCFRVQTQGAYTLIPFLKLITVSIKLPIGIMGRIYEALKGHYKANKADETENDDDDNEKGIMSRLSRVSGVFKSQYKSDKADEPENNDNNNGRNIMSRVSGVFKGQYKADEPENNDDNNEKGIMNRLSRVSGVLKGQYKADKADKPGNDDINVDNNVDDLEK